MSFSGLYDDPSYAALLKGGKVLDLTHLDGTCCFCDPDSAAIIRAKMAENDTKGIRWIDTGDYHYLTLFSLERIGRPFLLL